MVSKPPPPIKQWKSEDRTKLDAIIAENIRKEFFADYNAKDKKRDPFATTLASLVGGIPAGSSGRSSSTSTHRDS